MDGHAQVQERFPLAAAASGTPPVAKAGAPGGTTPPDPAKDDSAATLDAQVSLLSPNRSTLGAAGGAALSSAAINTDSGAASSLRCVSLPVCAGAPRGDFRLQQQAFEYWDAQGADLAPKLRVFGRELSGDGKRRFLVTSPARLWADEVEPAALAGLGLGPKPHQHQLPDAAAAVVGTGAGAGAGGLHLYEIIREGTPCHLYFDLEYVPALNPGVCGDTLVDLLLALVAEELASSCRVRLPLQPLGLAAAAAGSGDGCGGGGAGSGEGLVGARRVVAAAGGGGGGGEVLRSAGSAAGVAPTAAADAVTSGSGANACAAAAAGTAAAEMAVGATGDAEIDAGRTASIDEEARGRGADAFIPGSGTGATTCEGPGAVATAAGAAAPAEAAAGAAGASAPAASQPPPLPPPPVPAAQEQQDVHMQEDAPECLPQQQHAAGTSACGEAGSRTLDSASWALEASTAAAADAMTTPAAAAAETGAGLGAVGGAVTMDVVERGGGGESSAAVQTKGADELSGGTAVPSTLVPVPPAAAGRLGRVECPWAWELCSTTAAKWSRHLIVRIPHCAFKDNFHVNAFVRRLFDRIAGDQQRFAPFFVRRCADPAAPPTLFIDPAVYTRNRAFRLYLSSKAGKTAVLRATPRHAVAALLRRRGLTPAGALPSRQPPGSSRAGTSTYAGADGASAGGGSPASGSGSGSGSGLLPAQVEREIAEEVFFATLVTSVGRVDRILTMYDDAGSCSPSAAAHAGAEALNAFHADANAAAAAADAAAGGAGGQGAGDACWLGIPRLPLPGLGRASGGGGGVGGGAGGEWRRGPGEAFHYGPSPFPEVERFIESVCKEGGVQGRVRSWQHHADPTPGGAATLLLGMRDNRWCANVGRPHRSNGIYYLVDLRAGTWCQRCHDPDCRDFRSAAMPLPADVWAACRPKDLPPPPTARAPAPAPPQAAAPPPVPAAPHAVTWREQHPTSARAQVQPLQFQRVVPPRPEAMEAVGTAAASHASLGGGKGARLGDTGDDHGDSDFDMLCVEALERLERQHGL